MIGSLLFSLAALSVTPQPSCSAVQATLASVGTCVEAPGGIAIAADPVKAREMVEQAGAGADRFRSVFGREPSRWAVYSFDDPAEVGATSTALRGLGFSTVVHLPSDALRQQQMEEAMRRAQATRPAGDGQLVLPAEAGQALQGRPAQTTVVRRNPMAGAGEPRSGSNTVPHELGHIWYANAFWPSASHPAPSGVRRYGSAAPDWLDEAAAMLMEDESGAETYRQRFAQGRSPDPALAAAIPDEIPLATLIRMDHPTLAAISAAAPAPGSVTLVVPVQASIFYAQVRVFSDYLIEQSGNPLILSSISEGMAAGVSFDQWLASNGPQNRLPASLDVLQADWDRWLDNRFGVSSKRSQAAISG